MIDRLIEEIKAKKNPSVAGLDTAFEYLPDKLRAHCKSFKDAAKAITEFNFRIIDAIKSVVPAVKVQVAYYEMYGVPGMEAFADTLAYAKKQGLIVIGDVKRNDIGSTAGCYSRAYLGHTEVNGQRFEAFPCDFITVNGYLGNDGIQPFVKDCAENDKGLFILAKTSNPTSGELQDRELTGGETIYEAMGRLIQSWGASRIGKYGYSDLGAVVGATHPKQAEILRKELDNVFFLVPGYGAQGGKAEGLAVCFDESGLGAIVNSSRGILTAYRQERYAGQAYDEAAKNACLDMRADIAGALSAAGKKL